MTASLRLRAEDPEDMAVIAACLQDAVVRLRDLAYQPRQYRFGAVLDRFKWEEPGDHDPDRSKRPSRQVRSGIHFNGVLRVQSADLPRNQPGTVMELLTIGCDATNEGMIAITLVFSGGAVIRLEAECLDCYLEDLSEPWDAPVTPAHPL